MKHRTHPAPPWSAPTSVADLPETGRRIDLVADAAAREAVAKVAGVRAVERLAASFDLGRHGRDGVRVIGQVSARVMQTCVVTLEPVEADIDEAIDLTFEPPAAIAESAVVEEVSLTDDPPEVLEGDVIDLGAVATEFLLLGIDPYPRKPGVSFDAPPPVEDAAAHPFAALAALKKNGRK
jgi:uncharacterized metal-binding protein YceD (DUF177 family)